MYPYPSEKENAPYGILHYLHTIPPAAPLVHCYCLLPHPTRPCSPYPYVYPREPIVIPMEYLWDQFYPDPRLSKIGQPEVYPNQPTFGPNPGVGVSPSEGSEQQPVASSSRIPLSELPLPWELYPEIATGNSFWPPDLQGLPRQSSLEISEIRAVELARAEYLTTSDWYSAGPETEVGEGDGIEPQAGTGDNLNEHGFMPFYQSHDNEPAHGDRPPAISFAEMALWNSPTNLSEWRHAALDEYVGGNENTVDHCFPLDAGAAERGAPNWEEVEVLAAKQLALQTDGSKRRWVDDGEEVEQSADRDRYPEDHTVVYMESKRRRTEGPSMNPPPREERLHRPSNRPSNALPHHLPDSPSPSSHEILEELQQAQFNLLAMFNTSREYQALTDKARERVLGAIPEELEEEEGREEDIKCRATNFKNRELKEAKERYRLAKHRYEGVVNLGDDVWA